MPPIASPDLRMRLIRATERVASLRGFDAATVPEIAAEAGISVGLLYRYFDGKAGLITAIVGADRLESLAAIDALLAASDNAYDALHDLIEGWLDFAVADRRAAALVPEIAAQATRIDAIRAVVRDADAAIAARIAPLIANIVPGADAVTLTHLLVATLDGLVARCAIDHTFDPAPAGQAILRLLVTGDSREAAHDRA